jgi:hypothetical protein
VIFAWLSLGFEIASGEVFLTGGDAFSAVEAISALVNTVLSSVDEPLLVRSLIGVIPTACPGALEMVLSHLTGVLKREPATNTELVMDRTRKLLAAFHPGSPVPPFFQSASEETDAFDLIKESMRRLMEPETVFEEIEAIHELHPDGVFAEYPSALKRILQFAWIIERGERPPSTPDEVWERALFLRDCEDQEETDAEFAEMLQCRLNLTDE